MRFFNPVRLSSVIRGARSSGENVIFPFSSTNSGGKTILSLSSKRSAGHILESLTGEN